MERILRRGEGVLIQARQPTRALSCHSRRFAAGLATAATKGSQQAGQLTSVPLQCLVKALEQCLLIKRLPQEANGSCFERLPSDPIFREGRDEDDRRMHPLRQQHALEINAADIRHLDVHDQARGIKYMAGSQEIFSRSKYICRQSHRTEQAFQRKADRLIIVNDRNNWGVWQLVYSPTAQNR